MKSLLNYINLLVQCKTKSDKTTRKSVPFDHQNVYNTLTDKIIYVVQSA